VEPSEYEQIHRLEARHFWYRGVHALVLGALGRHMRAPNGRGRILDAGCGPGGLTRRLGAYGAVVALDRSPLALAYLAREGGVPTLQGDIGSLPLADESFDAVVSIDVLYHRAVGDDAAALLELARVCRPGGIIVLNLPAHDWLRGAHDRQVHTARRYTRDDLRRLAGSTGLQVLRIAWYQCALLPVAACLRAISSQDGPPRSDVGELPALINTPLSWWTRAEAALALRGLLPFGLSVFAVLRRPGGGAPDEARDAGSVRIDTATDQRSGRGETGP
jgi:SAM-dependent methyltransferase